MIFFGTWWNEANALDANWVQPSTDVVVLADPAHNKIELRKEAANFLSDFKAVYPQFDCLLLEWGVDSNKAISEFMSGSKDYQNSIEIDFSRITQIMGRRPFN